MKPAASFLDKLRKNQKSPFREDFHLKAVLKQKYADHLVFLNLTKPVHVSPAGWPV